MSLPIPDGLPETCTYGDTLMPILVCNDNNGWAWDFVPAPSTDQNRPILNIQRTPGSCNGSIIKILEEFRETIFQSIKLGMTLQQKQG